MKPAIKLFDNETMLYECQPNESIFLYMVALNSFRLLMLPLVFIFLFNHHFFKSEMAIKFIHLIQNHIPLAIGIGITIWVISTVRLKILVPQYWYFFTNQRCIIYTGSLTLCKNIIPYSGIIDIRVKQDPLLARLRIFSVRIKEKNNNTWIKRNRRANPFVISGLTKNKAEQITNIVREYISKKDHQADSCRSTILGN